MDSTTSLPNADVATEPRRETKSSNNNTMASLTKSGVKYSPSLVPVDERDALPATSLRRLWARRYTISALSERPARPAASSIDAFNSGGSLSFSWGSSRAMGPNMDHGGIDSNGTTVVCMGSPWFRGGQRDAAEPNWTCAQPARSSPLAGHPGLRAKPKHDLPGVAEGQSCADQVRPLDAYRRCQCQSVLGWTAAAIAPIGQLATSRT